MQAGTSSYVIAGHCKRLCGGGFAPERRGGGCWRRRACGKDLGHRAGVGASGRGMAIGGQPRPWVPVEVRASAIHGAEPGFVSGPGTWSQALGTPPGGHQTRVLVCLVLAAWCQAERLALGGASIESGPSPAAPAQAADRAPPLPQCAPCAVVFSCGDLNGFPPPPPHPKSPTLS